MRTRTRAESLAGARLNLTWDNPGGEESKSAERFPQDLRDNPDGVLPADAAETQGAAATQEASEVHEASFQGSEVQEVEEAVPCEGAASDGFPELEQKIEVRSEASALPQPSSARPQPHTKPKVKSLLGNCESFGVRLSAYRQEAKLDIEELKQRLRIRDEFIEKIESGDYDGLFDTYLEGQNIIYILNDIFKELNLSANDRDEMLKLLYKEVKQAGYDFDGAGKPLAVNQRNGNFNRTPLAQRLPKLLVLAVVIICAGMILFSFVLPYLRQISGSTGQRRGIDCAPLIKPQPTAPLQMNIPQRKK